MWNAEDFVDFFVLLIKFSILITPPVFFPSILAIWKPNKQEQARWFGQLGPWDNFMAVCVECAYYNLTDGGGTLEL